MRVAIFTDTFIPQVNGVARTLGRLASELKKREIPYLVFSPETGLPRERGYSVHFSPGIVFPFYPECKIALPRYRDISARLDEFRPDVIHWQRSFPWGCTALNTPYQNVCP